MAIKRTIVESSDAPSSTNSLWLKGNLIRAYINGKWTIIGDTSKEKEDVENLKKQLIELTAKNNELQKSLQELTVKVSKDLFEVVTQLPTENISTSRIYCVLSSTKGANNKYTEYAWIKQNDGTFAWEKMGEFVGTPDLSGYLKLAGGTMTGDTNFSSHYIKNAKLLNTLVDTAGGGLRTIVTSLRSNANVFNTNGTCTNVGNNIETFTFTLEDESTVTKKIRVL